MSTKERAEGGIAMAERVYPFNKPLQKPPGYNVGAAGVGATPPTKGHIYRPALPTYIPRRRPYRSRKNICCLCCIWSSIAVLFILLLLGIAGILLYLIYKPQEPQFSVRSLQIPRLNVTTTKSGDTSLSSEVVLQIKAKNPNKKVIFLYDESKVSVSSEDGSDDGDVISLGDGSFSGFVQGNKNTTVLKFDIKSSKASGIDEAAGKNLRLKYVKRKLSLTVELDTRVRVKIDKWTSSKVKIIVMCSRVPVEKKPISSTIDSETKCNLKFFKWFPFKPFK